MATSTDLERAARLRAARSYSGKSQKDIAAAIGTSVTTLSRIENGKSEVDDKTAERFIDACEVPRWFLWTGFDAPPQPEEPTHEERLEALERQMAALVKRLGGDAPAPPPDALLQPYEDARPKPRSAPGDERGRAGGSQ